MVLKVWKIDFNLNNEMKRKKSGGKILNFECNAFYYYY